MSELAAIDSLSSAPHVVTINGGSSSIKFALFAVAADPVRVMSGVIERLGSAEAALVARDAFGRLIERRSIGALARQHAADAVSDWFDLYVKNVAVVGIGHRIVHGGIRLREHQQVDDAVMAELRAAQPLDLAHLPGEIALLDAFRRRFVGTPQIACFDTAFHRDLPRVAKLFPIPRRYDEAGVRRMGFHGLSYTYLLSELRRIAGVEAADGRVILAHLGSGASMAAVRGGKPIDTSMGFTPTAGMVMGTRPGDLDPGLLLYLMRSEKLTAEEMETLINQRCGLAGVSETSADVRDLIARRATDPRATEAVDLFCYQAKKWIGSFAAALGGVDTLVFAGGVGEHSPEVRSAICRGLDFLGIEINSERNARADDVISTDSGRVTVRVIATDEELVIAREVCHLLKDKSATKDRLKDIS